MRLQSFGQYLRESFIRDGGVGGLRARIGLFLALILLGLLSAGCGGGGEEAPPPAVDEASTPVATTPVTTPAGGTTVGSGQAEVIKDIPFSLNLDQPVPPDFKAAYQRRSRILVEFYEAGKDPFYPQGLGVDGQVNQYVEDLRSEYPTIEFFTYDIANSGSTKDDAELKVGEYGTLAAQLGVGNTPFIATLAPASGGEDYVIKNLFQGYLTRPIVNQALFDLSAVQVQDNTSDVDVTLERLELTESGDSIEYLSIRNRSKEPVDLQGFTVRLLDPETGEVRPDSPTVTINSSVEAPAQSSVSVGRAPDVVDADGNQVAGTFEGGDELKLSPGDQVALLDAGGAVAATATV